MTLEEIIAAINEDSTLVDGIVSFANSTDKGKEVLNNFANTEFDKRVGDKISELHNRYDDDVFAITGTRKKTNQKSYDFVKEKMAELVELQKTKPNETEAIKALKLELKAAKESGASNEFYKGKLDESNIAHELKVSELEGKIATDQETFKQYNVINDLTKGRTGMKFHEGIPEEAIQAMIDLNQNQVVTNAKIENGKVVYYNEKGEPWLNDEFKAATAKEVNLKMLGKIIDNSIVPGGGGASQSGNTGKVVKVGTGDKAKDKLVLDGSTFSTRTEFNKVGEKALKAQGIAVSDKRYNTLIDEAAVEHKVSELELN